MSSGSDDGSVPKAPQAITDAIQKLDPADQAAVQTYVGRLKRSIEELRAEVDLLKGVDDGGIGDEKRGTSEEAEEEDGGGKSRGHEHEDAAPETSAAAAEEEEEEEDEKESEEPPFPPLYESGDDFDKAGRCKAEASDLKFDGDYAGALEKYTEAVLAAEPSALLYANRADCLLRLNRPRAAVRDCDEALKLNPDSAKALRMRGSAKKGLGDFTASLKDLSASQSIDYDDAAALDLKFVTERVAEMDHERVMKKVEEEEKLKKRAEEIKKAREEAKREEAEEKVKAARDAAASMPGGMGGGAPPPGAGGAPGSFPGMPGDGRSDSMGGMAGMMSALMSDPELAAGMQNPKVVSAFSELVSGPGGPMGLASNPGKVQELMSDPEVGPFMQKLMTKLGPMMGMGGAAAPPPPGGAAGGSGTGGGSGAGGAADNDEIPDLDEMPDLD